MKKIVILLAAVLFVNASLSLSFAQKKNVTLPLGIWKYGIYIGKNRVGTTISEIKNSSGQIISILDMTIKVSEAIITTRELTKETDQYVPVSYFSSTTAILNDKVTRDIISADFNGEKIKLTHEKKEKELTIKDKYYISGNYMLVSLLNSKLVKGATVKAMTYSPSYDEDELIAVSETVLGRETVQLPSGNRELFHTQQTIGPIKSINNYMDADGTVYKTTFSMLNMQLDLILESHEALKAAQ
jgi:hypothetical protein